jgi:hypothetical protein
LNPILFPLLLFSNQSDARKLTGQKLHGNLTVKIQRSGAYWPTPQIVLPSIINTTTKEFGIKTLLELIKENSP